jgi:hypothetical protein
MKILQTFLLLIAASTAAFSSPGGPLEHTRKIRVDPTVVVQTGNVDYAMAGKLIRYDLRAAIKDAHLEEADSPIHAFFVLDEFSSESPARKLIGMGSGKNICTVDGKLVFQDAGGKELASVKIHVRGSVAFSPGEGSDTSGRHTTSDLEQRLSQEIEKLK